MAWSYSLALWNANGLLNHRLELEQFLHTNKIDILLVSETHFTNRSYLTYKDYNIYHTRHPDGNAHGGTAVIIRKNIKHHEMEKYGTEHLQATTISVADMNGPITVSSVYCPPKHKISKDLFETYLNTLGTRFIVGGDFNAKHLHFGSRLNTPRGNQLYAAVKARHLTVMSTGEPTYWPSDIDKIPDLLDFFLVKGISQDQMYIKSYFDLSSDHTPILLNVHAALVERRYPPRLHNKFTNWDKFRDIVGETLAANLPLKSPAHIDEALEHLVISIQKSAKESTPTNSRISHYLNPPIIKRKIAEKRLLRYKWRQTRHPEDKRAYNAASRNLKRLLQDYKNDTVTKFITNLTPNGKQETSLWNVTRRLNRPTQHSPPLRNSDGSGGLQFCGKSHTFCTTLCYCLQALSFWKHL